MKDHDPAELARKLEENRQALLSMTHKVLGKVIDSEVPENVTIGMNSVVRNCTIAGPTFIGENCLLEDCEIGPFTRIGDGVKVISAKVENSIVLSDYGRRDRTRTCQGSLLGSNLLSS